uniref:NADH dehydrogenase [ubiquinone] 1 beta subcomplex subunit 4 n=1 Tax=Arion vulgaris TaxID=1028688 RepID=A0A0B6ZHJ0_9EUPU
MAQKKTWDPWKMYDISPEEMRAVNERSKMKESIRAEWTKKFTDPWKGSHPGSSLFDPAVQRYMSLKATESDYCKRTLRSAAISMVIFVLPVTFLTTYLIYKKREDERRYRSGEIMYKDRKSKHMY